MQYWPVVLADTVLLTVALVGGVVTLVRMRRVGGLPVVLAGAACGVLVVAAIVDMVWWTQLVPAAIDAGEPDRAATLYDYGVLVTFFMIAIGVGLLIAATNVGRPAVAPAEPVTRHDVAASPNGSASAIPPQYTPHHAQPAPAPQAQPAQGWTPPQQQPGQPDWNIHSGVWSIPRGTFDGPPPDQHQR